MSFSARPRWWQALRQAGLVLTLAGALATPGLVAEARESAMQVTSLAALPTEAQSMYRLIHAGGPFPNRKDGTVFGNRERALPREARGYYHEYTVRTPGARDRGARRIVCGGAQIEAPIDCYYTGDHYATFQRIVR